MYRFGSLPENLAAFCDHLRRDYGFSIGPRELQDAARALEAASLASEPAVRHALRPVLSGSREHALIFDRAFDAFFYPIDRSEPPSEARSVLSREPRNADPPESHNGTAGSAERDSRGAASNAEDLDESDHRSIALVRASYSPLEAEGAPLHLVPPDAEWRAAARMFVQRIRTRLSRKWKAAARGERFDLRRTLRYGLHTGGEAVIPRWRARLRRRPRIVVLIDGSRSMSAYAHASLHVAAALASATPDVEVFTFSTALERITPDIRVVARGASQRLVRLGHAWGGGTSIGTCLGEFVSNYGARMVSRDTVVVIASDGLDVGEPEVLRQGMAYLHRRAAGIVWLNPLRRSIGYEPTALGMRTAMPYLTTLFTVQDVSDLRALSRAVRLR
jgi:uncharacterized protein with von Willebrand factor type A (vWA) domain